MDAEKMQTILAMMRHEYSLYSVSQLRAACNRRKFIQDFTLFGNVLTESEMTELFDLLIKERT